MVYVEGAPKLDAEGVEVLDDEGLPVLLEGTWE
jgi:hypothetical protein